MLAACKENRNPHPALKEVTGALVITFYKNEHDESIEGRNKEGNLMKEYIR
jgi:hypothetical protein